VKTVGQAFADLNRIATSASLYPVPHHTNATLAPSIMTVLSAATTFSRHPPQSYPCLAVTTCTRTATNAT
jgi:hypothetical protein